MNFYSSETAIQDVNENRHEFILQPSNFQNQVAVRERRRSSSSGGEYERSLTLKTPMVAMICASPERGLATFEKSYGSWDSCFGVPERDGKEGTKGSNVGFHSSLEIDKGVGACFGRANTSNMLVFDGEKYSRITARASCAAALRVRKVVKEIHVGCDSTSKLEYMIKGFREESRELHTSLGVPGVVRRCPGRAPVNYVLALEFRTSVAGKT